MKEAITIEVKDSRLLVNGQQVFSAPGDAESFLKAAYHFLQPDYLKYFKMDNLSKLGFLGAETLFRYYPALKNYKDDEVALVFSNRSSSLDTDTRYWQGVVSGQPMASPALFVYTLPNIVQGEIAIRHKLYGENLFVLTENYSPALLQQHAHLLQSAGKAKAAITAWINYQNGSYHAVFKLFE